jgi:WhiB family redox-sensing transcriptional regulator
VTEHDRSDQTRGTGPWPSLASAAGDDTWNWRSAGLCAQVDPELFFPEQGICDLPAKQICAQCEVQATCLEWALTHHERYGVWGGTNETERAGLVRLVSRLSPVLGASESTAIRLVTMQFLRGGVAA